MSVLEVLVRLLLIAGSSGINLDGHLSAWLSGIVGLVAMAATVELAVRPYAAKLFDRLLLMAGSLIAALIVLGFVLNLTPWGMTLETWNVAWAALGLLVLCWQRRSRTVLPKVPLNVVTMSIVVAGVIIVGAGTLAISAVNKWDGKPVLAFSEVSASATSVITEIDATSVSGSYSIVAFPQASKTKNSRYTSKPFSISAGTGGQTIQEQVPVAVKGTWVIDLEPAHGGTVLRELIVDVA